MPRQKVEYVYLYGKYRHPENAALQSEGMTRQGGQVAEAEEGQILPKTM